MDLFATVGLGLALGFSLTVPPGPMNALIAAASARSYRAGFVVGLGAMSSDAIVAGVVLTLSALVDLRGIVRPVDALGAVALGYFGARLLAQREGTDPRPESDGRRYSTAVVVGLSNPFQILWWLTAGLAAARLGGPVLFAGLFAAVLAWISLFPYVVQTGAQDRPRVARGIVVGSAGIMFAFAGYFALLALGIVA